MVIATLKDLVQCRIVNLYNLVTSLSACKLSVDNNRNEWGFTDCLWDCKFTTHATYMEKIETNDN